MKKALVLIVLALGLAVPQFAHAQSVACADATTPCISGKTYGYQVTTSPIQLLAADGIRRCLLIQNQPASSSSVCIAQGTTATVTNGVCNGFVLAAGNPYIYSNLGTANNIGAVPTQTISAIGMSGNANVGYSYCH
jgi:hypothetical protein